jgi:hypothetical protein
MIHSAEHDVPGKPLPSPVHTRGCKLLGAGLALLALVLAACAPSGGAGATAPAPGVAASDARSVSTTSVALQELRDVGQLQALFAQDTGKTRLILLVSPT